MGIEAVGTDGLLAPVRFERRTVLDNGIRHGFAAWFRQRRAVAVAKECPLDEWRDTAILSPVDIDPRRASITMRPRIHLAPQSGLSVRVPTGALRPAR